MHDVAVSLFLAQTAATLFMTGLIWFVQIVHYPLFTAVGSSGFISYARRHAKLTGYVVGLPMLVELGTSLAALAPTLRPAFVSSSAAALSAVLLLLIWAVTGLIQVPLHDQLCREHNPRLIVRLVRTNWIRTIGWTVRSVLLLACIAPALHRSVL